MTNRQRCVMWLVVALGGILAAGCGPFVEVVRLDEATRTKVRGDVKQYTDLPSSYKVIQQLEATSTRFAPRPGRQ